MGKTGGNLIDQLFTFKYPGREPKFLKEFLEERPDILDYYIYDVNLTSGMLLYLSRGGIGVTKEPYIAKMHDWIKTSTVKSTLEYAYKTRYRDDIGKWKYLKLRERFNEIHDKLENWEQCAELYLLWVGSNFTHRYRTNGYDGIFFPTQLKTNQLINASRTSREKNLLFREEDLFSFKESIINDNVIVYAHLPREFGTFGAGWVWNKPNLDRFTRVISEFALSRKKILISAQFELRGRVDLDYRQYFPEFNHLIVPEFKDSTSFLGSRNSEIYLFNF
jgi:hypothetical protein